MVTFSIRESLITFFDNSNGVLEELLFDGIKYDCSILVPVKDTATSNDATARFDGWFVRSLGRVEKSPLHRDELKSWESIMLKNEATGVAALSIGISELGRKLVGGLLSR
jgi:hypothetical protein